MRKKKKESSVVDEAVEDVVEVDSAISTNEDENKIDTLDSESEGKLIKIIESTIQSIDLKSKGVVSISGFTGNNVNNLLGLIANEMNIKEA